MTTADAGTASNRHAMVIVRWLSVAITVFTLTLLGTFFVAESFSTGYTATAEMRVSPHDVEVPSGWNGANPAAFDPPVKSIITSGKFLLPMIKEHGFNRDWAGIIYETADPPLSDTEALDYIRWRLKIEIKPNDIVDIHVSDEMPKEAAAGANAVAERYAIQSDGADANHQPLPGPVTILSRAEIPLMPDQPDKGFYVLLTIVGGTVLGIAAATAVERIVAPAVRRKCEEDLTPSDEKSS